MTTETSTSEPLTPDGTARQFADDGGIPTWEARFRAPTIGFPTWSRHAPDHIVYASTESGRWQLHAWDLAANTRRRVTDEPVGVTAGSVTAEGDGVVWLRDESGDESGRFVVARVDGGGAEPLADELPRGWDGGLALGRERSIVGVSDAEGFAVYAVDRNGHAHELHRHVESVSVAGGNGMSAGSHEQAGLSADETLACLEHGEHGDLLHQALRVIDARTGETIADLQHPGQDLAAFAWSPVPGDDRILIANERAGERAPAIWHVRSREVEDLPTGLDGLVEPADWWPDASAVLLVQFVDGRNRLHRFDLESGRLETLVTEPGSIGGARVRPDRSVWYRHQSAETPTRLLAVGRSEPLIPPTGSATAT